MTDRTRPGLADLTPRPPVPEAVAAVREHFAGSTVEVIPDGNGGAFVTIDTFTSAPGYTPSITWLGFHINAAYPAADVYPHYSAATGPRTDGQAHGPGDPAGGLAGPPRAAVCPAAPTGWNPAVDNAALKAER